MRATTPVTISASVYTGGSTIEKFLTIPAAARALGVHPTKVRRAMKRGQFPSYRFGDNRAMLRLSEVVAYIESINMTLGIVGATVDSSELSRTAEKLRVRSNHGR